MSHDLINTQELCAALGLTRDQFRPVEKQFPAATLVGSSHQKHWPVHVLPETVTYKRKPLAVRSPALQAVVKRTFIAGVPETATAAAPVATAKLRLPAVRQAIAADEADAEQLLVRDARLAILNMIAGAVRRDNMTEAKAIEAWLAALADDSLPAAQQLWCAIANNKSGFAWEVTYDGGGPTATPLAGQEIGFFAKKLSKRTVQRWIELREKGGDDALIPRKRGKDMSVPAWAPYFLEHMQRPQKPTLKSAYEAMEKQLKADGWKPHLGAGPLKAREYPDYSTVTKWYKTKYSKLDAQKGRNTGSALNPFKFHHVRSAEGMLPLQEVHSDGWSTKFYAPHPISGKWVTGEVWHSHDVATRKAYVHERSIGLSESTMVIMGSLYAVFVEDGEPLFWQTGNTGAVKNDRVEFDPVASMAARRSIEIVHNLPGNSQANGIAESFNRYLQERAKELATYKGDGQDSKTKIRIHKITNKLTKAASAADATEFNRLRAEAAKVGCGIVFSCWADAVAWVKQVVAEFNDMPHRSLPKISDPVTGKRRHMTPNERMEEFIADGWERKPLSGEELIDAFRVHEMKRVTRGCIQIMGQRYHHPELDHHNGEDVLVAYDIEDGSQVYIKNPAGAYLYTASFCESRSYRMQSFVEIALNKRVDKQLERLDTKKTAIEAQRPGYVIDAPRSSQIVIGGRIIEHESISSQVEPVEVAVPQAKSVVYGELPRAREEIVNTKPTSKTIPRTERPVADNYAEWLDLKARKASGEVLTRIDDRFIDSWPDSNQGKAYLKFLQRTQESQP